MFDIDGVDELQVAIDNGLVEDSLDISMSTTLQKEIAVLNEHERLPLEPLGIGPVVLTLLAEKPVPSVL